MTQKTRFLDSLTAEGILSSDAAEEYSKAHAQASLDLLEALMQKNVAKRDVLAKLWGDSMRVSYVNLSKTLFQSTAVEKLPEAFARKHLILPLYEGHGVVTVATASPLNIHILDEATRLAGCQLSPVFALPDEIVSAIDVQYQSDAALNTQLAALSESPLFKNRERLSLEQVEAFSKDQAIVAFSRNLLLLALKERASDIHLDPQEQELCIRFRIDGVLQDRLKLDKTLAAPLSSRLKIMGGLDITEKRRPQDGRISLPLSKRSVDFRMSSVPAIYGEKIVLRALGQLQDAEVPDLESLNFSKANYLGLKKTADAPNGIFFVTGPTGSGKSTTLFSVLKYLNRPGINIMTIEDPVEYRLPGLNQVQVNHAIDFSFASALRAFLRQDPDVILVGEVRDLETAKIASQAALTGHLVLATLHTNTALQAVTRLMEIGVEPYLVAPSIVGVMAQRLVRKICTHCKEAYSLEREVLARYFHWDDTLDISEVFFYRGKGCTECNDTGYGGRLAIHEVFVMTEAVRALIAKGASTLEIDEVARQAGFQPMRHDGMKKVLAGLTSLDELERVTMGDV
ncbi:GspE/PulE family protein [Desulfobotulus mexicanus]|uniref:Type II/IV secretion system protein n=1 Tax=Desulfobotulus mexicanus TaxID=2586642 RepID=A0A5Q4VFZ8_9BACT|nr:GspE/PulE family protein [Desulfobotulus mexicanus]TYT75192.1 type II/IV secretion system protein [Desulfobotulus mexicanus]